MRPGRTAWPATALLRLAAGMRFLVLGGTAWLGRCVVQTALAQGHEVTCLARGQSGTVPDGAVLVRADRRAPDAYDGVADRQWDVVLDVARQPGQVRGAVAALADRTASWVFVSSGNVYADHSTPGADERGALLPALDGDVMASMDTYGEAKVACEQAVVGAMGEDRALVARVGLIAGPGDESARTGYWPRRFARPAAADGAVLVPDAPDLTTQVVDVRDLAAWLVSAGAERLAGAYDAVGDVVPLPDHLAVARAVAGHTGPVVPADPAWLVEQGVQPWMGERSLPLWLSDPDWRGFTARSGRRARAAGLVLRPLEQTLRDTLAWELARPDGPRRAGLTDEQELALLSALGHRQAATDAR